VLFAAAQEGMAQACLRFAGNANLVSAKLPALFVLDPTLPFEVGREGCHMVLDSEEQPSMISRKHAKLTCTHGRWKVEVSLCCFCLRPN